LDQGRKFHGLVYHFTLWRLAPLPLLPSFFWEFEGYLMMYAISRYLLLVGQSLKKYQFLSGMPNGELAILSWRIEEPWAGDNNLKGEV